MPIDLESIKRLIDLAAASNVLKLEVTIGDMRVSIERSISGHIPKASGPDGKALSGSASITENRGSLEAVPAVQTGSAIRAPMDGIVHLSPSPGAPAFVSSGQLVSIGDRVCLIEIMKTFHAVTAERAGTIRAVRVRDGQHVEHDDVLFELD